MQWTDDSPGEGNLGCLDEALARLSNQANEADYGQNRLKAARGGIPQVWAGQAAEACGQKIEADRDQIAKDTDSIALVRAGIKTYIEAVEDIKYRVNKARNTISDAMSDLTANPSYAVISSTDEIRRSGEVRLAATEEMDASEKTLTELIYERQDADRAIRQ